MDTTETQARTGNLFLARGLVALVWAALFLAASSSLDGDVTVGVGILLVLYPLIDMVATLIDALSQSGSARRLLLANSAVSAVAAVALVMPRPRASGLSSRSSASGPA